MKDDEHTIRELTVAWHGAITAGNVRHALELMSDDYMYLAAGRSPMMGRNAFESSVRDLLLLHRIELTANVREVKVSDDLAYCLNYRTVRVVARKLCKQAIFDGYTLSVLRKAEDGAWAIVRDIGTLVFSPI